MIFSPLFGIKPRRDFGRAHQVAEQHCQMPPLATNVGAREIDGRSDGDCRVGNYSRSAIAAEFERGDVLSSASRASGGECKPASAAEFLTDGIFGGAFRAAHRRLPLRDPFTALWMLDHAPR